MSSSTTPRHATSSPRTVRSRLVSLIGIILLPLVIASGFLWATSGTDSRLHSSEAAIVNLDEGATLDGKPVRLGQDYALDLKNQQGPNFTWRYGVSVADAQDGLASGRYSAAVVIPAGFSRVLTGTASSANTAGSDVDKATLVVERSPLSGVSDQVVFGQLSNAATHALGSAVARKYLDKVFVSSTELGKALWQTSALAQEASNGSKDLTAQAQQAQKASSELANKAATTTTNSQAVVDAATTAATSAKTAGTTATTVQASVTTTTTGNGVQGKAIAAVAGKAGEVSAAATKASTSTAAAAKQASAAGVQGDATQTSADAVAKAAAANKAAAAAYTKKVSDAVKQQQDLSTQLADSSKALDTYVNGTTTAAATVKKTVDGLKQVAAASTPASTPAGGQGIAPQAAPSTTATGDQITALATRLRDQATVLQNTAPTVDLTAASASADAAAKSAASVASSAAALKKSNAAVVGSSASAARSATLASATFATVAQQLSDGMKLPATPPCPYTNQNNGNGNGNGGTAAQCAQWNKAFRQYQSDVQAANAQRFNVKALWTAVARSNNAAIQSGLAARMASSNQVALGTLVTDANAASASAASSATDVAAAATALTTAKTSYDKAVTTLNGLASELDTLATAVNSAPNEAVQVKRAVNQALADPTFAASVASLNDTTQADDLASRSKQSVKLAQDSAKAMAGVDANSDAAKGLDTGATAVGTASAAQLDVVKKLQESLTSLNAGMGALGATMTGLNSQAASLSKSTSTVSDNASATATQVAELNKTISQLTTTVEQASTDASTASQKASALQQQVSSLQQASTTVKTSTSTVTTTATTQQQRTSLVAKSVAANQAKVPSYDGQQRQRLSDVVSQPISTVQQDQFRNVGWVSMLMLLALWAGAMGLHSVFAPVSAAARRSTASPERLLATEMAPAVVISLLQALAVAAVGQAALHMTMPRLTAVTCALMLAGVCFAAVNHALVAFLKVYGRLVAVAFALVTGASLVTSAYPETMGTLRSLSPITPALDVVRSLMTGAPGGRGSLFLLIGWLLVGALFSGLAILRARNPEPVRVHTVHEDDARTLGI